MIWKPKCHRDDKFSSYSPLRYSCLENCKPLFDKIYDEGIYARQIADLYATNHKEIKVDPNYSISINSNVNKEDGPINDPNYINKIWCYPINKYNW